MSLKPKLKIRIGSRPSQLALVQASMMRARVAAQISDVDPDVYKRQLEVLRAARRRLHADEIDPADRMRRLKDLANSALPEAIAIGDLAAIERILATCLGAGVGLARLGIDSAALDLTRATEVPE